jgi:hypothetical protein
MKRATAWSTEAGCVAIDTIQSRRTRHRLPAGAEWVIAQYASTHFHSGALAQSPPQVRFGKVYHLVRLTVHHGMEHVE